VQCKLRYLQEVYLTYAVPTTILIAGVFNEAQFLTVVEPEAQSERLFKPRTHN